MDHHEEFTWLADGEEAEVSVAAPDAATARAAFEKALVAASLPGAVSPVCVAAVPRRAGWVALSETHAAPDLVSVPSRSVLLVADTPVSNLGVPRNGVMHEALRSGFPELSSVRLNAAGVRRVCELGGLAAAEDGLIEEEDLAFLAPSSAGSLPPDPDALGRRSVSAGELDWNESFEVRIYEVGGVSDSGGAESLGVEAGMLAVEVSVGAGELGRIASSLHRERISARIERGEFDSPDGLNAAPLETEESRDLLSAFRSASNFADGRVSLALYSLRRAMRETFGSLEARASWRAGGFGEAEGSVAHRRGLAAVGEGGALVSGGVLAGGVGTMYASAPPFGAFVEDGRWLWEEAGLLERWADLDLLGGEG